jgi:hypothetical protein
MRCKNCPEPRLQLLSLDLAPDRLARFWDRVREKIALLGRNMFSDPILLVMAKGFKLRFRSFRWAVIYDRFFATFDTVLNRSCTVWAFYDWAKELRTRRETQPYTNHQGQIDAHRGRTAKGAVG